MSARRYILGMGAVLRLCPAPMSIPPALRLSLSADTSIRPAELKGKHDLTFFAFCVKALCAPVRQRANLPPQRVQCVPHLRRRRSGRGRAGQPYRHLPTPATSSGLHPRCVPPELGSGSKACESAEGGSLSLFGNKMAGDGRTMVFLYTVWIHPLKKIISQFAVKAPRPRFSGFLPLYRADSDAQTLRLNCP